jgi:hypothetical protein
MDTQKNIEERLWDYLNGSLSGKEKEEVEQLLQQNSHWRKMFEEMMSFEALMKSSELEEPSMRFSKNVMDEISKLKIAPATKSYINKNIIFSIAAFFLLIIGGSLVYIFTQLDFSTGTGNSITNIDFSKYSFDWKRYISPTVLNLFFVADAVVGLMLLDRYLNKKKREAREAKGLV